MSEVAVPDPPVRSLSLRQRPGRPRRPGIGLRKLFLEWPRQEAIAQALEDPALSYMFQTDLPSEVQLIASVIEWEEKIRKSRSAGEMALMVEIGTLLVVEKAERAMAGLAELRRPFSLAGDVVIVASKTASESSKLDAAVRIKGLFKGRNPVNPARYQVLSKTGVREELSGEKKRQRVQNGLFLACRLALGCPALREKNLPRRTRWAASADPGSFDGEVRARLKRAMGELLTEDLYGPGWRPKENPRKDSEGHDIRESPDPGVIELSMELAGVPIGNAVETDSDDHEDKQRERTGARRVRRAPDAEFTLQIEGKELIEKVTRAVESELSEDKSELFRCLLADMSREEMARRLGISRVTLNVRIHRLRSEINSILVPLEIIIPRV